MRLVELADARHFLIIAREVNRGKRRTLAIVLALAMSMSSVFAATGSIEVQAEEVTTIQTGSEKFSSLLEQMKAQTEVVLFEKPWSEWNVSDLSDYIREKIPTMETKESTENIYSKNSDAPALRKQSEATGMSGSYYGSISSMTTDYPDGRNEKSEQVYLSDNSNGDHVYATATIDSDGRVWNEVGQANFHSDKDAPMLYILDNVLSQIGDEELASWVLNEEGLEVRRKYEISEGEYFMITPNNNWNTGLSPDLTSRQTTIAYANGDSSIEMGYTEGLLTFITYRTMFAPVVMYRMYNPNTGEHFYTASEAEKNNLVAAGWTDEGKAWSAPSKSQTPVYRLYNPNAGDHHFTTVTEEKDSLVAIGWEYEGVGWYSSDEQATPLYRLYNPNCKGAGSHHYTTNAGERDQLIAAGWTDEGIAWYGM